MRVRKVLVIFLFALAALASPALASSPRVRVHLGLGWWYPGWWWGPVWAPEVVGPRGSSWTVVDTDVSPEAALVYLDGKLIGTADDFDGFPDYLYLRPPGRYELEFRLQGYESLTIAIDAVENHFVPINTKLQRKPGERRAAWYDRPAGLPVARAFEKDRPTESAEEEPARPVRRQDAACPDPSLRRELTRSPETRSEETTAVLVLSVAPDSAAVYLDGNFIGTAAELARLERGLAVTPGPHVVEALAPGFRPRRLDIELEEGARQQVVIELDAEPDGGLDKTEPEFYN